MSFLQPQGRHHAPTSAAQAAAAPASPSLGSVLSTANISSAIEAIDNAEWVLFSPQFGSALSARSPVSEMHLSDAAGADIALASAGSLVEVDDEDDDTPHQSLELPRHNGTGSFMINSTAEVHERRDLMERVNMWRLDQSELVFSELQRIERKFFPQYDTDTALDDAGSNSETPYFWSRLGQRVIANLESLIRFDDEVLDVLFGDKFLNVPADAAAATPKASTPRAAHDSHMARARAAGADHVWDEQFVSKLLERLDRQPAPKMSILRQILDWSVGPAEPEYVDSRMGSPAVGTATATAGHSCGSMSMDRWWDDSSSMSTQVF